MVEYGQGHSALREYRTSDVCGNNHSFERLQLKEWLSKSLTKNGYKWQSRVQEATLPAAMTGNDIIIQVQGGRIRPRTDKTPYGPKMTL